MSASNRWLVIVAAAIVLVVVAGIAVTVAAGGERRYAEGTPERVVQDYLRAVSDRDTLAAFSFFTTDLAKRCEGTPRDGISNRGNGTIRATLDRATVRGDQAEVRVRVTETFNADSPFGSGENTSTQTFQLRRQDGWWRIAESPWPLYCVTPERVPPPTPPPTATATAAPVR